MQGGPGMIKQGSLVLLLSWLARSSAAYSPHACSTPESIGLAYCDVTLPIATRIEDLISHLNTSEKVGHPLVMAV